MVDAPASAVLATVVITTKNRKEELRQAIRSALDQDVPVEVLVIDDGSTDGTSAMVRQEFPSVRLERAEVSRGLIVQRNHGAQLAAGPVIFSIDDDAAFTTPHIVRHTLAEFDHPRIGAVAIPFINVKQDQVVRQKAPNTNEIYVSASYIGTAHAVRRDLFRKLGGYREYLFHQNEEADFSIRMLNAGHLVRVGSSDPIHHFESPRRDNKRIIHYGRRNDVLYAWHNVPMPYLLPHMAMTTYRGVMFGIRKRRVMSDIVGLAKGYAACFHEFRNRLPVRAVAYRLSRQLKRRGMVPLREVEERFPDIVSTQI